MQTLKRTYALPKETLEQFEQTVTSGHRSKTLAILMEKWLARQREEALERDIIEGCREMWSINEEIEREFHPLEEEVARAYNTE